MRLATRYIVSGRGYISFSHLLWRMVEASKNGRDKWNIKRSLTGSTLYKFIIDRCSYFFGDGGVAMAGIVDKFFCVCHRFRYRAK